MVDQKALLVLEDGTSFTGRSFGAAARSHGEVHQGAAGNRARRPDGQEAGPLDSLGETEVFIGQ